MGASALETDGALSILEGNGRGNGGRAADALYLDSSFSGKTERLAKRFDIMSLRGYATHVMKRIEWRNRLSLVGRHDITMLVFTGPAKIAATSGEYRVDTGDVLLQMERGEEVELYWETLRIACMAGIDLSPA